MHARRVGLLLGMMFWGSSVAAQETQVAMSIVPDAARVTAGQSSERSFGFTAAEKLPAFEAPQTSRVFNAEAPRSVPPAMPRFCLDAPQALAPLRLTAERSSFLTEARIPLAQAWSGRLRLSGVQQRFHSANLYSALNPAYWAEIAAAPGVESIAGRARVNYGVGVQFRFGR